MDRPGVSDVPTHHQIQHGYRQADPHASRRASLLVAAKADSEPLLPRTRAPDLRCDAP